MPALRNHFNGQHLVSREPARCVLLPGTLEFLSSALKRQWKDYRKQLKRCQEKFSERAVHESRVETRRLISLLDLLGPFLASGHPSKAHAFLKRHLDTFDDLRDAHVQLKRVEKMLKTFVAAGPFCRYLEKREKRFDRKTRRNVKKIRTNRLRKLMDACRDDLEKSAGDCPPQTTNSLLLATLNRTFVRTRQLMKCIDPRNTDTIHCTRVAFKRFRYMIELLADRLPAANEKLLEAMHAYQTMMGEIQDAEVLLRSFDKFYGKQPRSAPDLRKFRQELLRRRERLVRAYLANSGQLLQFWPAVSIAKRSSASSTSTKGKKT